MSDHDHHHHDHDHHDDDHDHSDLSDIAARVRALESVLIDKGYVDPAALDEIIDTYQHDIGPRNGARVVARAWIDPDYLARLRVDATAAIAELGHGGRQGEHMVAVENTDDTHHVVVCTLCSCYPWSVLGLPPVWYRVAAQALSAQRHHIVKHDRPAPAPASASALAGRHAPAVGQGWRAPPRRDRIARHVQRRPEQGVRPDQPHHRGLDPGRHGCSGIRLRRRLVGQRYQQQSFHDYQAGSASYSCASNGWAL